MGIYKVVSLIDNKVYIGQAVNLYKRFYDHFGDLKSNKHINIHLQSAYNKYGKTNFIFVILELIDSTNNADQDRLNLTYHEQYYIDYYQAANREYGYNMCPAAESWLGKTHRSETIVKLTGRIKRPMTDEEKKHLSDYWRGIPKSKEHREHISQGKIGVPKPEGYSKTDSIAQSKFRYIIQSEDKTTTICKNMNQFARDFHTNAQGLMRVVKDITKSYKGWTCRYMTEKEIELYEPLLQGDTFWVILDYIIEDNT